MVKILGGLHPQGPKFLGGLTALQHPYGLNYWGGCSPPSPPYNYLTAWTNVHEFVVWLQHWLLDHHTLSLTCWLIETTLIMESDERVSVVFDQCEQNLSTNWLRMKHYRGHR